MSTTNLGNIIEAVERAHADVQVVVEQRSLYCVAAFAAAGDASRDAILDAIMTVHHRLDAVTQCRLADRIAATLKEPVNRSAPQRRPAGGEMRYGAAGRILSVSGRPVR